MDSKPDISIKLIFSPPRELNTHPKINNGPLFGTMFPSNPLPRPLKQFTETIVEELTVRAVSKIP